MVSVTKFFAVFAIIVLIGFGLTDVEAERMTAKVPLKILNRI